MSDGIAERAGSAVAWKGIQLVAGQAISLLRLLILARLLFPEDFGLLAIGLTTVNTILALTDVGMLPALVQHAQPEERHYDVAWTVGVGRAAVITILIILAAPWIAAIYQEPDAAPIIQVLSLKPLLEALASIKIARLTRQLQFRSLALLGIAQASLDTVLSIILAPLLGVWALVAGVLAGAVAYLTISYFAAPHRPRLAIDRKLARPLVGYGRWVFVSGVVAVSGSSVLQVIISRQLGAAGLGLYYLVVRLAFLFNEVATKVIGAVAFPLYARLQSSPEQGAEAFRAILTGMTVLLLPAYGLLIALAPLLEQTVLGARWAGASPVIQVLALAGLVGVFGDVVAPLLNGTGRPDKVAVLEFIQSVLIILSAWILISRYGLTGAAMAWLLALAASQLLAAHYVLQLLHKPFSGMGRVLAATSLVTLAAAAAALTAGNLLPGIIGLMIAVAVAGIVVGGGLLALDRLLKLNLVADLIRVFPQVHFLLRLLPSLP